MRILKLSYFALVLSLLSTTPARGQDEDSDGGPAAALPQIVRLSFLEGDVRLERGKPSGPNATGWSAARAGVPLESGYSLVTGNGRAEIEFEDASTAYIDANSAVTFNVLATVNDAPQTALTLLTGTMTLHVNTTVRGEHYFIATPQNHLSIPYPGHSYARVASYLDAMDVTPLSPLPVRVVSRETATYATSGHTLHYTAAGPLPVVTTATPDATGFDAWVSDRIQQHAVATARVMQEAGLSAPIPGLAELDQQGQFFPCAPFGTCWMPTAGPNAGWMGAHSAQLQGVRWEDEEDPFPCWIGRYRDLVATDPITRRRLVLYSRLEDTYGYNWAVCHAGSWIHREHRWVWVVGRRLHHRCPVHWVERGGRKGFVPVHPKDAKGQPPENLKHGLYVAADRKQGALELLPGEEHQPVKLLADAPRDFRKEYLPPLAAAEAPRLEAHVEPQRSLAQNARTAEASVSAPKPLATLSFNTRSQTFMLSSQADRNGHMATVTQPFGGRTDAAVGRSGGGSPAGFSSSGGGRASSSFSGGGAHSSGAAGSSGGGASSSVGGAFHSSSGPGSSGAGFSGAGSSGVSSAGASSSSGGGHH